MKKFLKKYYPEILSILLPAIILLIACAFADIYPLGHYSLARYDGFYQYPGFTNYFRSVLLFKNSLFYSFKGALGYNFYATSIYYLLNPTNILCVFFSRNNILEYYTLISFLRVSLCGFTMCKFLKYKFKDNKNMYLVIFSIAYALMGYNVSYMYNYMYFDTVVLFPIVMIGLEKLIHENKKGLYIFALSLSIISNFYIGYMVCIFSLLYFIYNYILLDKKQRNKKITINFIISSLLCGLICLFVLLPVIYELLQGKADLFSDPTQTDYFAFNLNFINFFYKSTAGSLVSFDIKYGSVNIYCSLLVTILVIKYFFNKKYSMKEKIVTGAFLLFFMLSISFNLIDFAWHMFQRPIWYPNRYIFTFSFLLITIANKSLIDKESTKMKTLWKILIAVVFVGLMIYPAFIENGYDLKFIKVISFALSIMMIIQYLLFSEFEYAKYLMYGLFFIEIILNTITTTNTLSVTRTLEGFKNEDMVYQNISNKMIEDSGDNSFYRAEWSGMLDYNNGASYNFNGVNYFNSLKNRRIVNWFDNYFDYTVSDSSNISYHYHNPYMNSILGIKYMTGANESYYKNIYDASISLYKNNDALSLGYMVNDDIYNVKLKDDEREENIKKIVSSMMGKETDTYLQLKYEIHNGVKTHNGVDQIEFKDDSGYVSIQGTAPYSGFIVNDEKAHFYSTIKAYVNGRNISDRFFYLLNCYFVNKGDKYNIKITYGKALDMYYVQYYLLSYDVYKDFVSEMKANSLNITNYKSDSNLEGTFTSTETNNVLFTTIPYEKGWNIYLNDKKVDYDVCYDTFICLKTEPGEYNIKLKYIPPYLIIGSIISFISIIASIIFAKRK